MLVFAVSCCVHFATVPKFGALHMRCRFLAISIAVMTLVLGSVRNSSAVYDCTNVSRACGERCTALMVATGRAQLACQNRCGVLIDRCMQTGVGAANAGRTYSNTPKSKIGASQARAGGPAANAAAAKDSMHPATANASKTGPEWCNKKSGCTPAPSVGPPKTPPSQGGSSCPPLQPGATAVPECSAPPPGAKTILNEQAKGAKGPKLTFNGQERTCYGWDSSYNWGPVDCSRRGAFIFTSGDPLSIPTQSSDTDAPVQPAPDNAAPAQTSPPGQPIQQARGSDNDSGDDDGVSLPLKPKKVAAKTEECRIGKCNCASFPVSKVPVIRFYPICDNKCGLDTDCFKKCSKGWSAYNDDANEYNRLSKQACPQNYSED